MTILSREELVQRAGIDPWALHAKIAVGDPAQVEDLAAAFYKAGGNMSQARDEQKQSAKYREQGYTSAGTSPIDFNKEAESTAAPPENLQKIGKILDGVASDLSGAMKTANDEAATLDSELSQIEGRWTSFMQQIGHHLPPDDQEAEREGLINEAVGKVKSHGTTIDRAVKKYEETIFSAQKSMSDLGYVPPATLDDLYGDGAEYVHALQKKARELADKLKNNQTIDGDWAKLAHQVAGEAAPYMNDPYFAAAFYGDLGPRLTQQLPELLYTSGSTTKADDLKTFSHMFGTAVSNQQDDPHMAEVANSFLTTPKIANIAWDRGAMVSNGDFPPDWLAKAARYNALDTFAQNGADGYGHMGWQGTPNGPYAADMGLSANTLALWTEDLGQNPIAAREALATMGNGNPDDVQIHGDPTSAYETNIHKLVDHAHGDIDSGDLSDGYGAAFEAAAGADDEHDGAHSAAAITFARALFTDMHQDNGLIEPNAAPHMAKIGASYVEEMAAGNRHEGTGITGVEPLDRIAGDNAAFGIPPELAKEFCKTFVGSEEATHIFDTAAGQAAHHAMLAGAKQDVALLHDGKSAYALNNAAQAYGSVAGSENGAALQVIGKRVEDEEHAHETMRGIISAGIDLFPAGGLAEDGGKLLSKIPDLFWDASKHGANMGLEAIYGAEPGSQEELDHLKDANYQTAMVGDYERTSILREAGYPGTDSIPKDLLTSDGQMVNVATVMGDDHLRQEYYEYMHHEANAPEGSLGRGASVYEVTKNAAGRYQDAYQEARGNDEGTSGE